jgi:hypothetical protein
MDQTGWVDEWSVVNTQTEGGWFTGTRLCERGDSENVEFIGIAA